MQLEEKVPSEYDLIFAMPAFLGRGETMAEVIAKQKKGVENYEKATQALRACEGKQVFVLGAGRGYSPDGLTGRLSGLNEITTGTYFSVGKSEVELFGFLLLAVEKGPIVKRA